MWRSRRMLGDLLRAGMLVGGSVGVLLLVGLSRIGP